MKKPLLIALAMFWSLTSASVATAQPLEETLRTAYTSLDGGFATLRSAGASYEGLLTLERLPTGRYLGEVAVLVDGRTLRYPVKLQRSGADWSVVWQPDPQYAAALTAMAKGDALPAGRSPDPWRHVARMPALGVVATRARIVTPFGVVDPAERAEKQPPGGLDQSPTLIAHGQRWVRDVLDEDPAPAGFDLLVDARLDWRALNKVMFNLSAVGLYQIWLVTRSNGALHQIAVAAPVGLAVPETPVVALQPLGGGRFGFRLTSPDSADAPMEECAPGATICAESEDELAPALDGRLAPGGKHAMFAATGEVAVADGLRFLTAFVDYMGLAPHGVLLGYIER